MRVVAVPDFAFVPAAITSANLRGGKPARYWGMTRKFRRDFGRFDPFGGHFRASEVSQSSSLCHLFVTFLGEFPCEDIDDESIRTV